MSFLAEAELRKFKSQYIGETAEVQVTNFSVCESRTAEL